VSRAISAGLLTLQPRVGRVATITAPGTIDVSAGAVREPGAGEVRVRLEGCGVCGSNLPVWEGRDWFEYPQPPGAPGHEGWGIVDAVGEGIADVAVGERVAILSSHAFAEYDFAPAGSVIPIPGSLADVPVPGEPLGCAMNAFRRSGVTAGDTVAIVGIGFLGALLTQLASRAGARVIAISRRPYSLDVARSCGAADALALDDHQRVLDAVSERTDGRMCDVVIEAIGMQSPLDLAGELTRERGRLVIAGFHQDGPRQVNMFLWNWRGLDVINAHERDPTVYADGVRAAMEAMADGMLDPALLYTHQFPLEEAADALNAMRDRPHGFLKALVQT
jgi:threonine dehydrogenase-like Zn-dependent dehydrogenase